MNIRTLWISNQKLLISNEFPMIFPDFPATATYVLPSRLAMTAARALGDVRAALEEALGSSPTQTALPCLKRRINTVTLARNES